MLRQRGSCLADAAITFIFKAAGLYGRAYRQFLNPRIVENTLVPPGLPPAFDGFRILHLSDLHLDLDGRLLSVLLSRLEGLAYDWAVFTGDYRDYNKVEHEQAGAKMRELMKHINSPACGVLGNHDVIEMTPALEDAGLRLLLNENTAIERAGEKLYIAGVDDPYCYGAADLEAARRGLPEGAPALLLCHSPALYREAAAAGFAMMLCGHTHGGQICLPGGFAIVNKGRCPRRMVRGPWTHGRMQGYTSPGAGACGVPLRFFCPGEITLHTLRRNGNPRIARPSSPRQPVPPQSGAGQDGSSLRAAGLFPSLIRRLFPCLRQPFPANSRE